MGKETLSTLLVGIQIGAVNMEIIGEVPYKAELLWSARWLSCAQGTDNPRLFLIPQSGSKEQLLKVVLLPLHMHAMAHTHLHLTHACAHTQREGRWREGG